MSLVDDYNKYKIYIELTWLFPDRLHVFAFLLELFPLPTPSEVARFSWTLRLLSVLPSIPSPHFVVSGDASSSLNSI